MPVAEAAGPTTLRIDAGSSAGHVDASGNTWSSDRYFVGGLVARHGPIPFGLTADPTLYRTERYGMSRYHVPVTNGEYLVVLHFAETYTGITAAGQRVFGVSVNGASLGNMDPFAKVDGLDRATSLKTSAHVTNGYVDVAFKGLVQSPTIDALEIVPQPASCAVTLQSQLDAAAPGAVVKPPACIYRESLRFTKPVTLDGQGLAEVRGSDVWTAWSSSGSQWVSTNAVPDFGRDTPGAQYVDEFRAAHLEQVALNGAQLTQVPNNPQTGQFALDGSRHVILPVNPTGQTIEVTTRNQWASTQADNVTIKNFTFRDAATAAQSHAIGNDDHANFTLTDSKLTNAHGGMVGIGGGDVYSRITDNYIAGAGDVGLFSWADGHALISGNTVTQNGFGGWNPLWQTGGIKLAGSTDSLTTGNVLFGNNGPGLWCDVLCKNVEWSFNRANDNLNEPNIFFEISAGAKIHDNISYNGAPGWPGIYISSSANAEVYNNFVYNTDTGIQVWEQNRADAPAQGIVNTNVHDNKIAQTSSGHLALLWGDYGNGHVIDPASNNSGSNNLIWYVGSESSLARFQWGGTQYPYIATFDGTPGGTGSRYLTTATLNQDLQSVGLPTI